MPNLLKAIANTGIYPDTPFQLRNKLRVLNNAVMIIIAICVFYFVVGMISHYYYGAVSTFFSVICNLFVLFLVKTRRYKAAFHFIMWYGLIFLSSFSVLFGRDNNSCYYFLFLPVATSILFDETRTTATYFIICAVILMANVYYIDHVQPYYAVPEWLRNFNYPNVVCALLLVFLGVRLFKEANNRYAKKVEDQNRVLEEKNREITDSINYAQKIQAALIPSEQEFTALFREAFVFFKPKDIVSGDFYWVTRRENKIYYATADCTGHGVPGGFMTMLGMSFLDELINEKHITKPAQVLDALRERLIHTLKQTGMAGESKDGMDIVLCCLDLESNTLDFAGANNSLYLLRDGAIAEYKGDKQPCGFYHELKPFTDHQVQVQPGDYVYTFTDGYADQFGGLKGKKFKYRHLLEELLAGHHMAPAQQKAGLEKIFNEWRLPLEQVDDVLLIGVKI